MKLSMFVSDKVCNLVYICSLFSHYTDSQIDSCTEIGLETNNCPVLNFCFPVSDFNSQDHDLVLKVLRRKPHTIWSLHLSCNVHGMKSKIFGLKSFQVQHTNITYSAFLSLKTGRKVFYVQSECRIVFYRQSNNFIETKFCIALKIKEKVELHTN